MTTPFDDVIDQIAARRYHNHRREEHSDIVSEGILRDLQAICPALHGDLSGGLVQHWLNVRDPGRRGRKIDLLVGEPHPETGKADITKARICIENKSVITAHRNKDARFDDLHRLMLDIHEVHPDIVLAGTVLIGTAVRVLNVPDRITPMYEGKKKLFASEVLPRLSSGDETLWEQFPGAISKNRPDDPEKSAALFRRLPVRHIARTHEVGYDALLIVPFQIDNVHPPALDRSGRLDSDIGTDYRRMLETVCLAYTTRWHT